jgi:hypothetical protein
MRIDGNVFENVNNPIVSMFSDEVGFWDVEDNIFENITASGTCVQGASECRNAHDESTTAYTPPYVYDIMPAEDVKQHVLSYAGADAIDECLDFPEGSDSEAPSFDTEPKDPPAAWSSYRGDLLPDQAGALELADDSSSQFELGGDTDSDFFSVGAEAGTVDFDTSSALGIKHFANHDNPVNNAGDYPKHLTTLVGVTGNDDDINRVLEIEMAFADAGANGSRLKTLLRAQDGSHGIQLEDANNGESVQAYGLDMSGYRVYQISVTLTEPSVGNVRVTMDHFEQALEEVSPSVDEETRERYEEIEQRFDTAEAEPAEGAVGRTFH